MRPGWYHLTAPRAAARSPRKDSPGAAGVYLLWRRPDAAVGMFMASSPVSRASSSPRMGGREMWRSVRMGARLLSPGGPRRNPGACRLAHPRRADEPRIIERLGTLPAGPHRSRHGGTVLPGGAIRSQTIGRAAPVSVMPEKFGWPGAVVAARGQGPRRKDRRRAEHPRLHAPAEERPRPRRRAERRFALAVQLRFVIASAERRGCGTLTVCPLQA